MISAYTISQEPVKWDWDIPWHNEVENRAVDKYRDTDNYLKYIAEKRNRAVSRLLEKYPETTDILCCDSSYVKQTKPLNRLIWDYEKNAPLLLGGAIYGPWRQRIEDVFRPRITFSDPWGVPSLKDTKPGRGLVRADGVSGVHIFPVSAWKNGARYGTFPDKNTGTETTFFARTCKLGVDIDMDAMFYRERVYSRIKCLRVSLAVRTRLENLLFERLAS